jgi:hypothetical protein
MTLQNPPDNLNYCTAIPALPESYSPELRKLVLECYNVNASARPTAINLLNACIQRGFWKESCVSPYGTLIASDFDSVLKESWHNCLYKINHSVMDIALTPYPQRLLDDTVKIMELADGRYGELAIFIAGETSPLVFGKIEAITHD